MDYKNFSIRLMTENDLEPIMVLKNLLGWNQTEADWKALMNFEPKGCFVAVQKDVVIGTATTTSYGTDLGWIGMLIVHPDKRNLGIGRELLNQCIQYLNDIHVNCIKLDATPIGKKLYLSFGFRDEYTLKRIKGKCKQLEYNNENIIPLQLEKIKVFDKKYFIADRSKILDRLYKEFPNYCFQSIDENGNINGYVMVREGISSYHLGPLVSENYDISINLFSHIFSIFQDKEIIFDIGEHHKELIDFLIHNGFIIQRELYRMYLGNNPFKINDNFVVASSSAEKG